MDEALSERLSQYFDCLLEGPTASKSIKTDSYNKGKSLPKDTTENGLEETESQTKKKKKKKKKVTAIKKKDENMHPDNESVVGKKSKTIKNSNIKKTNEAEPERGRASDDRSVAEGKGFTDDGFKIVSSIPEDDSDVSDAFESCSEEEGDSSFSPCHRGPSSTSSPGKPKETEDGFKIVTEIPPDDSDVSDAFEDDEDDVSMSSSSHQQRKPVNKPILQIMNDFGIDGKALTGKKDTTTHPVKLSKRQKKLKNRQANTLTVAAKRKKRQGEVQIIDYAEKRGVKKERKSKEDKEEEVEVPSVEPKAETLDEKQLKRVRYDVFKLGMSGFHKEKKEDTRVTLAIKLGAKPPKNKAVNYKKLMVMKKEEKKKAAEEKEMKLKLGLKVPKPFKKKEKPVVKASTPQAGRYRHGVQVLSKRDIAKINKS